MSDPFQDTNPEEAMIRTVQASFGAIMDAARPVIRKNIRDVLERNETIVHQIPAALDHLTDELMAVVLPDLPFFD